MCAICQHEKVLHTACSVLEKIQTGFTEDQQLSFFGLCKSLTIITCQLLKLHSSLLGR